ncbi:MAG TPA: VOC family protein [Blastocatellia bacterium]|nr:VOC family protein [Blastocatellia bacterium]
MSRIIDHIKSVQFLTVKSKNLTASRQFYIERLGLSLLDEKENEFFQFGIAGVPICVDYHRDRSGKESNQLGIETSDVPAVKALLESQGIPVREGQLSTAQLWIAIEDPDGHEVIFIESRPD